MWTESVTYTHTFCVFTLYLHVRTIWGSAKNLLHKTEERSIRFLNMPYQFVKFGTIFDPSLLNWSSNSFTVNTSITTLPSVQNIADEYYDYYVCDSFSR